MHTITCPHCQTTFELDESSYARIAGQVRDQEFSEELSRRSDLMRRDLEQVYQAQQQTEELKFQRELDHQRQIQAEDKQKLVQQITDLQHQLAQKDADFKLDRSRYDQNHAEQQHTLELKIEKLQFELDQAHEQAQTQLSYQLQQAMHEKEKEIHNLQLMLKDHDIEASRLSDELKTQITIKDHHIQDLNSELERLRHQRMRLSTKLIGESLEQHCEQTFNRERMRAFPRAEFCKDNKLSADGTKGDYIFRELDDDGVEIISIMFEMKNEDEQSKTHQKNEHFFKKLDADRSAKGCEYAVLVSTLEPDNEYYNEGIVNVSYRYPKMYVIRPQFFIPMIALLREAAQNAHQYRRDLENLKNQEIDIHNFEEALADFKDRFSKNYEHATSNYAKAIDAIDAAIKKLESAKKTLQLSERQLGTALKQADELTIRKLTYNNPTMKAKFMAAAEERRQLEMPIIADHTGEQGLDPDVVE